MFDCDEIRPRLTAWIDNELPEAEADFIQRHLERCLTCTAIMDDYKAMRTALKAAPVSETADLWNAISTKIGNGDESDAVLNELRRMREEMTLLREEVSRVRGEVADLQRELSKRAAESVMPRTPSRFPGLPQTDQRPYRLV